MAKVLLFSLLAIGALTNSNASSIIDIVSYLYHSAPETFYVDSGGELTDDQAKDYVVWPGAISDVSPLVGWQTVDGDITFNFDSAQAVGSLTLWMADSDGSAGVVLPGQVRLIDGAAQSIGTFDVTNPAGSGTTVPIVISGFTSITDSIRVELLNGNNAQWSMLTEVEFAAVPEFSSYALFAGLAMLGWVSGRRKRS